MDNLKKFWSWLDTVDPIFGGVIGIYLAFICMAGIFIWGSFFGG